MKISKQKHKTNYKIVLSERALKQLSCILGNLTFDEMADMILDHNECELSHSQVPKFKDTDFETLMEIYDFYCENFSVLGFNKIYVEK
jgi:hypothetical protein